MLSPHLAKLPSPGAYAAAWRKVCALPPEAEVYGPGWNGIKQLRSASDMRAEMLRALDRRINIRGGDLEACNPVPIEWYRDARRLEDIKLRRIRVYQFERPEVRAKFGHLLARHDD